jgi:hypothetical protein
MYRHTWHAPSMTGACDESATEQAVWLVISSTGLRLQPAG